MIGQRRINGLASALAFAAVVADSPGGRGGGARGVVAMGVDPSSVGINKTSVESSPSLACSAEPARCPAVRPRLSGDRPQLGRFKSNVDRHRLVPAQLGGVSLRCSDAGLLHVARMDLRRCALLRDTDRSRRDAGGFEEADLEATLATTAWRSTAPEGFGSPHCARCAATEAMLNTHNW